MRRRLNRSDNAPAHAGLVRALVQLGDGAGAQADLLRARRLGASVADINGLLAQALLLQGDADGALRAVQAGEGKSAEAARVAARAWQAKGDNDAAQRAFDDALHLAPRAARTWIDLGRFRLMLGDQAGAIAAADKALALAPGDPDALTLRGMLIRDQYGLVAALPWFERALDDHPNAFAALTEYAATLADAGRASRALSVSRRILALDPGNPRAWFLQAVIAARAGQIDCAARLLPSCNPAHRPRVATSQGFRGIDGFPPGWRPGSAWSVRGTPRAGWPRRTPWPCSAPGSTGHR